MVAEDVGQALLRDWRELLRLHAKTWCSLDRALHEGHGLGASDFEVLERLVEAEQDSLRVQELADAVHLSQSALSRLIGRLERAGLVTRKMCSVDRRGIFVSLTDAGRARHAEAKPTHRAVLADVLGDRLAACQGLIRS